MSRAGTVAKTILKRIEKIGPGSTWTFSDFKELPTFAVAKALSRLAKEQKLTRVRKGIYHYPKKTILGPSMSSPLRVLGALNLKTYLGGSSAAYNLNLTTQVPAALTFYGDVSYGEREILGTKVRFRRRNISHLKSLGETEVNIIETLRNIKKIPATTPSEIIISLKQELRVSMKIRELLRAIEYEPPRVRALIGAMCEELKLEVDCLDSLFKTLNPLTYYTLGVKNILLYADKWNIR